MIFKNQTYTLPFREKKEINMKIVNLTPHDVVLIVTQENIETKVVFPKSGNIARVTEVSTPAEGVEYNGIIIPLITTVWGNIENLPEQEADTKYLVSSIVASAAVEAGRDDILVPADFIRNEEGMILGCKALRSFSNQQKEKQTMKELLVKIDNSFDTVTGVLAYVNNGHTPIPERMFLDLGPEAFIKNVIDKYRKEGDNTSFVHVTFKTKLGGTQVILNVYDTGFNCQHRQNWSYISKEYGGDGKLEMKEFDYHR